MDKEQIKQQAKQIMTEFFQSLQQIPDSSIPIGMERKSFVRESTPAEPDEHFTVLMLENAPKKKERCIIAEKKHW